MCSATRRSSAWPGSWCSVGQQGQDAVQHALEGGEELRACCGPVGDAGLDVDVDRHVVQARRNSPSRSPSSCGQGRPGRELALDEAVPHPQRRVFEHDRGRGIERQERGEPWHQPDLVAELHLGVGEARDAVQPGAFDDGGHGVPAFVRRLVVRRALPQPVAEERAGRRA